MIQQRTRFATILAAGTLAVAGSGTTALADRDHPEDGPHHGQGGNTSATVRHFEGTVLSKDRDPKRFRIRTEGGAKRKFRINAKTRFERISGFGALDRGLEVEVDAKRTNRGLVARQVEKRGGASGEDDGSGGGADDPAGDDNGSGGSGADDPPGDDHGSRGGGADDPPGDDHGSGGGGSDDGPNHT